MSLEAWGDDGIDGLDGYVTEVRAGEMVAEAKAPLRREIHDLRNELAAARGRLAMSEAREKVMSDALWDIANHAAFFSGERELTSIARRAMEAIAEMA